jgi:zinc transport system substrate-binding protein
MNTLRSLLFLALFAPLFFVPGFSAPANEPPVVLVTVKPLGWLVQALAPADADVQVLVPGGQSPHDYQLRPADVARIQRSALLVWVGPGLEPWLDQMADRLPPDRQQVLLPHAFHEHAGHEHEHETAMNTDPHVWLDPLALREQAVPLSQALVQLYPAQADEIRQRLAQFQQDMSALDQEMSATFRPLSQAGFVVYHDGYQRLVQRYHLNQRAAVWQHDSIPAGAKERAALLGVLNSGDVKCLFYEPEHGRDAVNSWLGSAATQVKMAELDPLGETITDGADAYERFMRNLAGKMAGCLQPDKS